MEEKLQRATEALAAVIRDSEEYRQYKDFKDAVMENDTNKALLKEYQRTQTKLQMAAVSGHEADADDVSRFQQLSSLLYMNPDVAQYLLSQMRVQQQLSEVFQALSDAADLEIELPEL